MFRELAAVREGQDRALMEVSSIKSSAASDKDRAMATTSELQKRVAQLDQHATHLTDKLHAAEETARAAATTLHAAHASEMQKLREAHAAELQVRFFRCSCIMGVFSCSGLPLVLVQR